MCLNKEQKTHIFLLKIPLSLPEQATHLITGLSNRRYMSLFLVYASRISANASVIAQGTNHQDIMDNQIFK